MKNFYKVVRDLCITIAQTDHGCASTRVILRQSGRSSSCEALSSDFSSATLFSQPSNTAALCARGWRCGHSRFANHDQFVVSSMFPVFVHYDFAMVICFEDIPGEPHISWSCPCFQSLCTMTLPWLFALKTSLEKPPLNCPGCGLGTLCKKGMIVCRSSPWMGIATTAKALAWARGCC